MVGIDKGEFITLCLTASYVKAMRLFYSIYRLCELGLADESNLQLRTMQELRIKMEYLSSKIADADKDEFSRQWAIWCKANDLKFITDEEHVFSDSTISGQFLKWRGQIKTESEKIELTKKAFVREGPWNMKFKDLCKELGMEKESPIYSLLSGTAHCYDLFRYARRVGGGVSEADLTPIPRSVSLNLTISVCLLYSSLRLINIELALGKEKPVEEIGRIARAMMGHS